MDKVFKILNSNSLYLLSYILKSTTFIYNKVSKTTCAMLIGKQGYEVSSKQEILYAIGIITLKAVNTSKFANDLWAVVFFIYNCLKS